MFSSAHHQYIRAAGANRLNLHLLAHSSLASTRRRVAENYAAPIDVLDELSRDPNSEVRIAVGLNRRASEEILQVLTADPDPDVRYALAEASYLSLQALKRLSEDDNPFVCQRARRTVDKKAGS